MYVFAPCFFVCVCVCVCVCLLAYAGMVDDDDVASGRVCRSEPMRPAAMSVHAHGKKKRRGFTSLVSLTCVSLLPLF